MVADMKPDHPGPLPRALALVLPFFAAASAAQAAEPPPATRADVEPAVLARIVDEAMKDDWAWQHLADLTDRVGPRLSGSPGAEAAVKQVVEAMRDLGMDVTLQAIKVPHWVRGDEAAELTDYAGRPAGIVQPLHLTTLGASTATPAAGLTAPVLVVHDYDELKAHAAEVPGKIVLFADRFDQALADNGRAMTAYVQNGEYRFSGPGRAAELGAAAALVRSVGGAEYRLPHTGVTIFEDGKPKIPCAALAAEDADLVARLASRGPVTMHLTLTPQTLPDADSHNVLADLKGREKPDEVVIVSGHLDSWDLGTGAIDDGAGVVASMAALEVLHRLHLKPRRTVRMIAWMNEENGSRGATTYAESVKDQLAKHVAAIESDAGAGRPYGIAATVTPESLSLLAPAIAALRPIGATGLERRDDEAGADIGKLQAGGVPGFAPLVDTRHYFDYHHTAADTLDKVDPDNLRRQVATLAVLAYRLAEMPQELPRKAVADN